MFEKVKEEFSFNEISITYSKISWDSEYLKNNTYEVFDITGNKDNFKKAFIEFEKHIKFSKGDLMFIKIPTNKNDIIQIFNSLGFYFIEQTIEPKLQMKDWNKQYELPEGIRFERARKEDLLELSEIASQTFRDDRYHIDINIDSKLADFRYKKWIENSFELDEYIYVMRDDKDIIGFSIFTIDNNLVADYRLGGLNSKYIGKGYGKLLYNTAFSYLKKNEVKRIETLISLNNIPVLNVYGQLGFKFYAPKVVMHKVKND